MTTRRALLGAAVPTLAVAATALGSPAQAAVAGGSLPAADPLARAVRAIATQDFAPARVVVFGSSTTEGFGSSRVDRQYTQVLEHLLRRRPGGMFRPAGSVYPSSDEPTRLSGAAVNAFAAENLPVGWAGRAVALLEQGAAAEFSFQGTGVQLVHSRYPTGPTLRVTVNGATQDVSTSGAANQWTAWQSAALPRGSHTLRVESTGGGIGYLQGFRSFDGDETSGVHLYEGGRSGWQSSDYLAVEPQWSDALTALQPDLLVLQLGVNDISNGRPRGAIRDDLVSIVRKVRMRQPENSPSVIIVGSAQTTTSLPTATFRRRFTSLWQEAADQVGGVFLDPSDVLPSPGSIGNLYGPDRAHLSDAGHAALGYLIARLLPMLPPSR